MNKKIKLILILIFFAITANKMYAENPLDSNWRDFVYDKQAWELGPARKIIYHNETAYVVCSRAVRNYIFEDTVVSKVVNGIVQLNDSLWNPLGTGDSVGVRGNYTSINDMLIIGNNLFVAGIFDTAGFTCSQNIASWDISSSTWTSMSCGFRGRISSLASDGTNLFVGGYFDTISTNIKANGLAKWNGSNWDTLNTALNGPVRKLLYDNGYLYVVGDFDSIGTIPSKHFAIWDNNSSTWSTIGINGPEGDILSICKIGNNFYFGGVFDYVISGNDTILCNNITVWDGSTWDSVNCGINGRINEMINVNSELIVVGDFVTVGDDTVNNIAKWNGTQWSGYGSGTDGEIITVTSKGDSLLIGGDFYFTGDILATQIGIWYIPPPPLQQFKPKEEENKNNGAISLSIYPNPSSSEVTFEFYLDSKSYVEVKLFDILGNELNVIARNEYGIGTHKLKWNSDNFNSGTYICKLLVDGEVITKKFIISK